MYHAERLSSLPYSFFFKSYILLLNSRGYQALFNIFPRLQVVEESSYFKPYSDLYLCCVTDMGY